MEKNAIQFTNARSAACWTLPGTSSIFTGLMPHQHGATSQTRWLDDAVPTLAEKLKPAGYKAIQVTANGVTTDVFNLQKGFDEVYKTWDLAKTRHPLLLDIVLSLNRPRIRRMILKPKDGVFDKLSHDLKQGIIWAQKTAHDSFAKAKEVIEENNAKGQGVFMFINMMETHYPYHIADTFGLLGDNLYQKAREWRALFHFLSQTFLKKGHSVISEDLITRLRKRQQLGWQLIKNDVDNFCREMHDGKDNLIVFCSDHGDNFGDQGWEYHFSNVTDGGNRVPLFWLGHDHPEGKIASHNVSSRFMHQSILEACGINDMEGGLLEETATNLPVLQSYWYDNEGQTLDQYKYNQLAFIEGDDRFVLRAGKWMHAKVATNDIEPTFKLVENKFNPVEELKLGAERKLYLDRSIKDFSSFSDKIMAKEIKK